MRNLISVFLVFGFGLVLLSCQKDTNEKLDISGTYTRTQVEATYEFQAKLTFLPNGAFTWEPVGNVEGHSGTGANYLLLSDTHLRIINDNDCGSESVYAYVLLGNKLTLTHTTDDCPPRINALEGEWQKQ